MDNRKKNKILIPICFILIFLIYYFSKSQAPTLKYKRNHIYKTQNLEHQKLDKLNKAKPKKTESGNNEFDCFSYLYEQKQKCDLECYNKYLSANAPEVFSFIKERWLTRESTKTPTTKLSRFYSALEKAGIMVRYDVNVAVNLPQGIEELRSLVTEDPTNLIPRLYLATALDMHGDVREAQDELKTAAHSMNFNDYTLEWVKKLYLASMSNPEYIFHAITYYSQMPIASTGEMRQLLEKYPYEGILIARKMTKDAIRTEGKLEGVYWMGLQYVVSQKFLERYSPAEAASLPNYSDLLNEGADKTLNEAGPAPRSEEECDLRYLEKYGKVILKEIEILKNKVQNQQN